MSDDQHPHGDDERIDALGRNAGEALRRPAPPDGIARVRSSQRRRRAAQAVAGVTAAVVVVAGLAIVLSRDTDDDSVPTDPTPTTVEPDTDTTEPGTVTSPSDPPTTSTPDSSPSSQPPTSPPVDGTGWSDAPEPFPPLAFIACCGSDWLGEPSPAIPTDPAAPLEPGIYNATSYIGGGDTPDSATDGVLTIEIRPYVRCDQADGVCNGDPPHEADALGVPNAPARTIDVPLDGTVRVALAGFKCSGPDELVADEQLANGPDYVALATDLDAAYDATLGAALRAGATAEEALQQLASNPTDGFSDPGCPAWTNLQWTPDAGPSIIARSLAPTPFESASAHWIFTTAISVDDDGALTVYFYGGFLS